MEALIEASWEVNNAFETYLLDDEDEQSQSSGDIEKNKVQREEEVASDEMRVKLVHRAAAKVEYVHIGRLATKLTSTYSHQQASI